LLQDAIRFQVICQGHLPWTKVSLFTRYGTRIGQEEEKRSKIGM